MGHQWTRYFCRFLDDRVGNRMVLCIHESRGSHHSNHDQKGGLTQEVNRGILQKEQVKRAGGPIAKIFKWHKMDRKYSWDILRTTEQKGWRNWKCEQKDKRHIKSIQVGQRLINRNPIKTTQRYKGKDSILPWWVAWGHVIESRRKEMES